MRYGGVERRTPLLERAKRFPDESLGICENQSCFSLEESEEKDASLFELPKFYGSRCYKPCWVAPTELRNSSEWSGRGR